MKKIYFAPTPWCSSQKVFEDYKYQTPNNLGIWEDVITVNDPNDAEFLIIQDDCPNKNILNKFEPKKRLYFNREALHTTILNTHPDYEYRRFSFWDGSGYLPIRWWYGSNIGVSSQGYGGITKTYDELMVLEPYKKTKEITCILSNKVMNEGHEIRKTFAEKFMKKYPIDIYGSVEFKNCSIPNNDKILALKDYKYCLGFDNQDFIKDFFGTQLSDTLLSWTIPIFWCGTDLSRYLPEGSYIQFNAREESEIDRIIEIINNDNYDLRLPALKEARNMILNKYNFWPTIKKVIDSE